MKKFPKEKRQFILRQSYRKFCYEQKQKSKRLKRKHNNFLEEIKNYRKQNFIKHPNKSKKEILKFPASFSLLENPVYVIDFFNNAKKILLEGMPIYFDLSEITNMGPETLVYMCALFSTLSPIRGNIPNDSNLKEMFNRIGFMDYVKPDIPRDNYSEDVKNKLIHMVRNKKVYPELAAEVVTSAMEHTLDINNLPVKRDNNIILIELMGNTWNHSNDISINGIYDWWLLAYKDPLTKITRFCFLDLGVGIFVSLNKKYKEKSLTKRLIHSVIPENNPETLARIFKGTTEKKSSTNKSERGLGLKNIYDRVIDDANIKNFTIISDDVKANIGYNTPDKIERIDKIFNGTFYSWELIPNYESQ